MSGTTSEASSSIKGPQLTTVTRKDNGTFLARVRKTGFKSVSQSFIRKSDALAWGRRIEADMQAGRHKELSEAVPTLKDAIAEYRTKVAINLKGCRDYGYVFQGLEDSPLGLKPLGQVKPAGLAEWRDTMTARGLAPATVARRLGLLSAVLSYCQRERGWLAENPMRMVRKPTVRDARTRTLDPEEVRYLSVAVAAARAKWLPDAITLLIQTAMRRSELVGLRCSDVDMSRSVAVLLDAKCGGREVPLSNVAKEALGRLIDVATQQGCKGVLPIEDPEAVSFAFRRAVVRARARYEEDCTAQGRVPDVGFMEGIRLHDLRHHYLSEWARTGALDVFSLMKISGHSSPKMLARYVNISSEQVAAKLQGISAGVTA